MSKSVNSAKPYIVWIAIILSVIALRETRTVTMPLGLGLFLAALAWPLQRRLEQRLPVGLSITITLLVFWGMLALFVTAMVFCAGAIADGAEDYQERFVTLFAHAKDWLRAKGVPAEALQVDPAQGLNRVIELLAGFVKGVYSLIGLLVVVGVYFFLALLEVHAFRGKLESGERLPIGPQLLAAASEVAHSIERFVVTRTLISLAMGVLTMAYTWLLGLDFALVWGISAFLLNYIPYLGGVVAVILPGLVALIQPEAAWLAPATVIGLTAFHMVLGNYVDPWVQGKYLLLSPLVLFFSLTFWGWVWGGVGILLSIPLTAAVIIVCKHFERTRWVADLFVLAPPAESTILNEEESEVEAEETAAHLPDRETSR